MYTSHHIYIKWAQADCHCVTGDALTVSQFVNITTTMLWCYDVYCDVQLQSTLLVPIRYWLPIQVTTHAATVHHKRYPLRFYEKWYLWLVFCSVKPCVKIMCTLVKTPEVGGSATLLSLDIVIWTRLRTCPCWDFLGEEPAHFHLDPYSYRRNHRETSWRRHLWWQCRAVFHTNVDYLIGAILQYALRPHRRSQAPCKPKL